MNDNPLKNHFRKPEIFISLPSNGKYWPEGSLNFPATGEMPVLSMTASDELYLLTPDALINGDAIVSMIQNCVPGIINAWHTPSIDLETILVAIRIASVGEKLAIESTCAKCSETQEYDVDLRLLVLQQDPSVWSQRMTIDQLTFDFKPLNFEKINSYNQKIFESRKKLQQVSDLEDFDTRDHTANQIMNEFNNIDLQMLIDSIAAVQVGEVKVTDRTHIHEFILNCDKKIYSKLRSHADKLKDSTKFQDVKIDCTQCGFQYTTGISLDYSSFFALGS
jgi:bacterioferritin-associated ferredoxin